MGVRARRVHVLGILLLALVMVSGCSKPAGPGDSTSGGGFPVTLEDGAGNQVTIPHRPERIVSLAPSNTEVLFALGLKERIKGVTDYCNYPPEALKKEKVGGYSDPNLEKIISLKPDLVVAGDRHDDIARELKNLSIPVIVVKPRTLQETLDSIEMVGKATGTRAQAVKLVQGIKEKMDEVHKKVSKVDRRPRVYFEVWYNPIVTVGPGTVIDDIITLCGGVNIAKDAPNQWPQYSEEMVIAKNPEVIIHCYAHGDLKQANIEGRTRGWSEIKAVRNHRIYAVNADIVNRPGPRVTQAIDAFARSIHPELFK